MPGAFGGNVHKEQPPLPQNDAIDEMFGGSGMEFNAPTLQPTPASPPGKGKQRASADMSTKFQSNNPFLTSEERERQQQMEMDAEAARAQQPAHSPALHTAHDGSTPPALPARPGGWSSPQSPQAGAAVLTHSPRAPDRALPPPPEEEQYGTQYTQYHTGEPQYSSPPVPPPTWQQHQSPSGPPPGWQDQNASTPPALTLTAPSRNGTVEGQFFTATEERPPRPLPRPSGPPKVIPGPNAVNHMRQVSGGNPAEAEEWDEDSDSSTEWGNTPDQSPEVAATIPAVRAPSPAFLDAAGENALEMLADYDTVFLIDDSTSMAGERWEQAQKAVMGVVQQAVRYDRNGIDCYFLNSKRVGKGLRVPADVEDLFAGLQPRGATPTGLRMETILRDYMSRLERSVAAGDEEVHSMNLIVVTDGGTFCGVGRGGADTSVCASARCPFPLHRC
jgi:hypothetical protein